NAPQSESELASLRRCVTRGVRMEKKAGVWPRRRHWGCSPRSDRAAVRAFCCRAEKDSRPLFLLFRALDDVFGGPAGGAPQEFSPPGPLDTGGGQASDPGGGGAGLPSAGDSGGGSASPMMVSNSSDYGGAPSTSSGGSAGTYNSTSSASPTSPLLPPTASSSPAKPAPMVTPQSTAGTSLVHTVAPPVAPLTTDHSPPTTTPLTSPPVLTTAQLLGAAEQGHLFVQGTLNSKEPAGGILQIDIFGRAPGSQLDGTLLGSVTATATASGSVPFQGVLKADVPASEAVAAVLREGARAQTFLPADSGQWSN